MKKLLSGNEAIALGAFHAGVKVAAAYPGTPSTEILEALSTFQSVYTEWSVNEKVAMEVAVGAAYGGVRAMASMKHVGLNVASDPFFAVAYTGVKGGLVVVSADDPGIHSSQNEQDNRNYAKFAKVPLLEPADSQEAYDLMTEGFAISERFDTPVILRTSTRVSHSKSVVEVEEGKTSGPAPRASFTRDPDKYVMIPANARKRHPKVEQRLRDLAVFGEDFALNRLIIQDRSLGIVTSGVAYRYAREAFPEASFLKLALSYPLPPNLVRRFADRVEKLVVVEELDPFLEEGLRNLGLEVAGKKYFPILGEFTSEVVKSSARQAGLLPPAQPEPDPIPPVHELPPRPPVLCPGCPHSSTFYLLKKLGFYRPAGDLESSPERQVLGRLKKSGVIISGDIGCYTLSVLPPLLAMDTTGCMGASIGNALGLEKAGVHNKVVAVIGDSTFLHSGITPLLDVVYNRGTITTIILDNGTTAMTGHQEHPGTGRTVKGEATPAVDLEKLVRSLGVEDVHVVNAYEMENIESALRQCVEENAPSVIIVKGPCPLKAKVSGEAPQVNRDECDGCGTCFRLGCPAIGREGEKAYVDGPLCVGYEGCGLCLQICPRKAILVEEPKMGELSCTR